MALDTEPDPIAVLIQTFQYGRGSERRSALKALALLGPAAAAAVPDFIAALRDVDLKVRQGASVALARIGAAAVTPLVEALLDEDIDLRRAVIVTLGRIGPAAAAAEPVLREACNDEQLKPAAEEALAALRGRTFAELAEHGRRSLPLALLLTAGVVLIVGVVALFLGLGATEGPADHLAWTLAVAGGFLGVGLGAVVGGSLWGRPGALLGCLIVGIVGVAAGMVMGQGAAALLTPLVRALDQR